MLGFDTIGSATIVAYDGAPILTTDAWISDSAYFGSWGHDFAIPAEQMAAIREARYHWFSHGHPDHLNIDALPSLTRGTFLLGDHYGGRIARDLTAAGHKVRILKDWEWTQLSPSIRVCCIANQNQDSILLIDINGRLIINTNDSPDFGEAWRIRRLAKGFREVYLLQLHGWGGADMLNLFDPDGRKLTDVALKRRPIAPRAQRSAVKFGANRVIPFSSFHCYRRTDSIWANDLVPALADYQSDALPDHPAMLPAHVRVSCETDEVIAIAPPQLGRDPVTPEACGDSWSDPLTAADKDAIVRYFQARESLRDHFGFIEVKAGGTSVTVDLNPDRRSRGLSFEAPRNSFMTCIEHEIFDDLLIGNYMKTTLHGGAALYPDFTPFVAKYADNGGARSKQELGAYFGHYFLRDPLARTIARLSTASEQIVRAALPSEGPVFQLAKRTYYALGRR